jgi:hypothetical protein
MEISRTKKDHFCSEKKEKRRRRRDEEKKKALNCLTRIISYIIHFSQSFRFETISEAFYKQYKGR